MSVTKLLYLANAGFAIFQDAMAVCVDGDTRQNLYEHRQPEKVLDVQLALSACEFILTTASARSQGDVHSVRVVADEGFLDQPPFIGAYHESNGNDINAKL